MGRGARERNCDLLKGATQNLCENRETFHLCGYILSSFYFCRLPLVFLSFDAAFLFFPTSFSTRSYVWRSGGKAPPFLNAVMNLREFIFHQLIKNSLYHGINFSVRYLI
jgi:hypothetical protein